MAMRMLGTWDIISSTDFDDGYLNEEGPPYIQLRKDRDRIIGEYQIGLQTGSLDGRPQRDGSILFSFEGMDEMDEVNGAATARLHEDRLVFTLLYHQGDDYSFEATRRS
jgi:hypothetical protein